MVVPLLPDLTTLSHTQKDALIVALWEQVVSLTARVTALEQKLNEPAKTPDNSSLPPSKGQKPNRSDTAKPAGARKGSLGRKGGGRSLMAEPDQVVSAKAAGCRHCGMDLGEADQQLHSRRGIVACGFQGGVIAASPLAAWPADVRIRPRRRGSPGWGSSSTAAARPGAGPGGTRCGRARRPARPEGRRRSASPSRSGC